MKRILILVLFVVSMIFGNDKLDELIKYNEKLSTLYKEVGPGMMGGKYNLEFDKLINYPNGSCSQQGYLLARKGKELGFNVQQIGLFAKTGANDVMVNASDDSNKYLFIPSAGAYYKNSLWQILENIELAPKFLANKSVKENVLAARNLYLTSSFFGNLDKIKNHHLNNYEFNLLKLSNKVSSKNLFEYPNNEKHLLDYKNKYYTAGKNNKKKQSIEYRFNNHVNNYRFYFQWYSSNDYAKKNKNK